MNARAFWRWSRTHERPWVRYRRMRAGRGFSRTYALILALGFDGVGT